MSEPRPYYETPSGAPSRVRLYLGDCREIMPLVAPPSPRVLVLADPPYGVNERTRRASLGRGKPLTPSFRRKNPKLIESKDWPAIAGDADAFDPSTLLAYPRAVIWGANHFCDALPPTPSMIVWDKRNGGTSDDNADGEVAWTNLGGPLRVFSHLWRGVCRASERGDEHLHPTQKPVAFYRWLFAGRGRWKPVVSRGDLIVVPYLGSGPEIPAAMELGLDVIGIDVEREYLDTAIKHRIEPAMAAGRQIDIWTPRKKLEEQQALFGGNGAQ